VSEAPRAPIFHDKVLDDPDLVRRLLEANGPYLPVQRYFANDAEYRASSAAGGGKPMIVAPNFRGDWAYDRPLIDGIEPLLEHAGFCSAARSLFGAEHVRPFSLYANITWQLPFDQGGGHTDVPEFRGVNRTAFPTTFLAMMGHSRLFEPERIEIATTVSWFYEGSDGGFSYWPGGPDRAPHVHEGHIFNTAVTGDNERMYHRVRPTGSRRDGMLLGMDLDTRLEHRGDGAWAIVQGDEARAEMPFERLRISVSWKARVFVSEESERLYNDHSDDLTLPVVLERFGDDLSQRGIEFAMPEDPTLDPGFIETLSSTYMRAPTVFEDEPAATGA
jgi:hypothetical protein